MFFRRTCLVLGSLVLVLGLPSCAHKRGADQPIDADATTQGLGEEPSADFQGWGTSTQAPANQSYHFEFDRSTVAEADVPSVRAQGEYLKSHPGAKIRIEGNTDARGSREYNVGLGYRRAGSVASMLKSYGARASQLVILSWGREKPVAMGDSEESYRLNRRVDLVYERKE